MAVRTVRDRAPSPASQRSVLAHRTGGALSKMDLLVRSLPGAPTAQRSIRAFGFAGNTSDQRTAIYATFGLFGTGYHGVLQTEGRRARSERPVSEGAGCTLKFYGPMFGSRFVINDARKSNMHPGSDLQANAYPIHGDVLSVGGQGRKERYVHWSFKGQCSKCEFVTGGARKSNKQMGRCTRALKCWQAPIDRRRSPHSERPVWERTEWTLKFCGPMCVM